MGHTEKFWDKIAEKYSRTPIANEAAYQKKLEITRKYFTPDSRILEFGCGTGSTALLHAPFVQHIDAIDISSNMIDIAKEKAEAEGIQNVSFAVSDIDSIDAKNAPYDAVLGLSILHLLNNRNTTIRDVYNFLKPGGVFVSSTACLGNKIWPQIFRFIGPLGRLFGLLPMVRIFSGKQLEKSLIDAGFEIDYRWVVENGLTVFIVAKKK